MQIPKKTKDGIKAKRNTFSLVQKQLFADVFQKASRPATLLIRDSNTGVFL